jgi:hypothetical protein
MKMTFQSIISYFKGKSRLTIAAILLMALGEWSRRHDSWTRLDKDVMGKSYRMKDKGVWHQKRQGHKATNNSYIVGTGDDA